MSIQNKFYINIHACILKPKTFRLIGSILTPPEKVTPPKKVTDYESTHLWFWIIACYLWSSHEKSSFKNRQWGWYDKLYDRKIFTMKLVLLSSSLKHEKTRTNSNRHEKCNFELVFSHFMTVDEFFIQKRTVNYDDVLKVRLKKLLRVRVSIFIIFRILIVVTSNRRFDFVCWGILPLTWSYQTRCHWVWKFS